jgi:menaquinone-dependent protoporphyrinogen oxidase
MNVLVAYASRHGATRGIAERIAGTLQARGLDVTIRAVKERGEPADYDAFVIGSAAYMFHWLGEATTFVRRHRELLVGRPVWLFSSGPLDPRLARADLPITPHGIEITEGLGAIAHRTFGGRLAADAPIDPQVLATHPIGDFRDWEAIRAYAAEIGAALSRMTFPAPDPE